MSPFQYHSTTTSHSWDSLSCCRNKLLATVSEADSLGKVKWQGTSEASVWESLNLGRRRDEHGGWTTADLTGCSSEVWTGSQDERNSDAAGKQCTKAMLFLPLIKESL
jgi:hypothetical protein